MEAVGEEAHVMTVGVRGFIARVALKLHLGSQTRERLVCHHPSPCKAGRRIAVGTPILEMLNTAPPLKRLQGRVRTAKLNDKVEVVVFSRLPFQ